MIFHVNYCYSSLIGWRDKIYLIIIFWRIGNAYTYKKGKNICYCFYFFIRDKHIANINTVDNGIARTVFINSKNFLFHVYQVFINWHMGVGGFLTILFADADSGYGVYFCSRFFFH